MDRSTNMIQRILPFLKAGCLAILLFQLGCSAPVESLYCDVETEEIIRGNPYLVSGKNRLSGAKSRSDEASHSGKWSVKLNQEEAFGLGFKFENLKPGDRYHVSVWRKGKYGFLVFSADAARLYRNQDNPSVTEGEWQKLEMVVTLPPNLKSDVCKVYAWNNKSEDAYFDDLRVTKLEGKAPEGIEALDLSISEKRLNKLEGYVHRAMDMGRLSYGKKDWKKAILKEGNSERKIKMRLKGDWPDHYLSEKWSFRIRVKGGKAWQGKRTFSIMNPIVRDHLNEWVYHQMLDQANVLTTTYEFVPVRINGNYMGIYAWEEHFEKHLIESRDRREGPILKFFEDGLFELTIDRQKNGPRPNPPLFAASPIVPFQAEKVAANPVKLQQFLMGQRLLENFRTGERPASAVFDLQKLADFAAISDLCRARHSNTWHNLRYYYNPVTCRLEPIGYDGYTDKGPYNAHLPILSGLLHRDASIKSLHPQERAYYQLFTDPVFLATYAERLAYFSQKETVESLLTKVSEELNQYESWLQADYPGYAYDREFLSRNAQLVQEALPELQAVLDTGGYANWDLTPSDTVSYAPVGERAVLPAISARAHATVNPAGRWTVEVTNFHTGPLELVGAGNMPTSPAQHFGEMSLPAYTKATNTETVTLPIDTAYRWLFYRIKADSLGKVAIWPWPDGAGQSSRETLDQLPYIAVPDFVETTEQGWLIPAGNHLLDRPWTIPAGTGLTIAAGAKLDLKSGAFILSYSAVRLNGTAEAPIRLYSSDNSGMGLTVLQAPPSLLSYASFESLNSFVWGGWEQTGAVNFYQTEVQIDNCLFARSFGEDALNLFHCAIQLNNCRFEDTRFDAFDGDFCTGMVQNCWFSNIGDDGIDFSGSNITIQHCDLSEIADKGISIGEGTQAEITNTTVSKARTGISVKDRSAVSAASLTTNECKVGIGVFVKKPEFGPAKLSVDDWLSEGTAKAFWVDLGCELKIEGETHLGSTAIDVETLFY